MVPNLMVRGITVDGAPIGCCGNTGRLLCRSRPTCPDCAFQHLFVSLLWPYITVNSVTECTKVRFALRRFPQQISFALWRGAPLLLQSYAIFADCIPSHALAFQVLNQDWFRSHPFQPLMNHATGRPPLVATYAIQAGRRARSPHPIRN